MTLLCIDLYCGLGEEINECIRNGNSPMRWTNPAEHYFGKKDGVKVSGLNWNVNSPTYTRKAFNDTAVAQLKPFAWNGSEDFQEMRREGVKGFTPNGERLGKNTLGRKYGSKSQKRKAASALIAKIPFPLSQHIAQTFKAYEEGRPRP